MGSSQILIIMFLYSQQSSGDNPCSTFTGTGYEHEADHQCYHPDQITSTGTRRGGRDRPGDSSQPRRYHLQGSPPEPDLGMLPPGPRKTVGGQPRPSTSAQQRLKPKKPSAQSVKRGSGRIEEGTSQRRREEERKKAAARAAKKRRPESSKRRSEEVLQVSTGNCCPETDKAVSKIHGTFD